MKGLSTVLNILLFFVMAVMCIMCISDHFEKGEDTFSVFLQAFSVMVFAIINIRAVNGDD